MQVNGNVSFLVISKILLVGFLKQSSIKVPNLLKSFFWIGLGILEIVLELPSPNLVPQLEQNIELSASLVPQFEQNIDTPPIMIFTIKLYTNITL